MKICLFNLVRISCPPLCDEVQLCDVMIMIIIIIKIKIIILIIMILVVIFILV